MRSGELARRGAVLLEVIVAVTLLATAGLAAVALTRESVGTVQRVQAADAELRRADAFLRVVSLWPREDLDRRLGDRAQGPWRLVIGRPTPTLYLVSLTDAATHRPLLHTALFRPEPARATP